MKLPHRCVVCGSDLTGRDDIRICSRLCWQAASKNQRRSPEYLRRKYASRNAAYRRRRVLRQLARKRAERHADPAWQAWRAEVDARKREQQERSAALQFQRECRRCGQPFAPHAVTQVYCDAVCARKGLPSPPLPQRDCRACGRQFTPRTCRHVYCSDCGARDEKGTLRSSPEFRRELWTEQRANKRRKPGFYAREQERRKRPQRIIRELRELGWLDSRLEVVVPGSPPVYLPVLHSGEKPPRAFNYRLNRALTREHRRLTNAERRPSALPGQIIVVNPAGIARKVIVDRRAYSTAWTERYKRDLRIGLTPRMARALRREALRRARDEKWPAFSGQTVSVDRAGGVHIRIVDFAEYRRGWARQKRKEPDFRAAVAEYHRGYYSRPENKYKPRPKRQVDPEEQKRRRELARLKRIERKNYADRMRARKIREIVAALDKIAPG